MITVTEQLTWGALWSFCLISPTLIMLSPNLMTSFKFYTVISTFHTLSIPSLLVCNRNLPICIYSAQIFQQPSTHRCPIYALAALCLWWCPQSPTLYSVLKTFRLPVSSQNSAFQTLKTHPFLPHPSSNMHARTRIHCPPTISTECSPTILVGLLTCWGLIIDQIFYFS